MSKFALLLFVTLSSFGAVAQQAHVACVDSKGGTYSADLAMQKLACQNAACSIADGTSLTDLQLEGKLSQVSSESANELGSKLRMLVANVVSNTDESLMYVGEMVSLLCSPPIAAEKLQEL